MATRYLDPANLSLARSLAQPRPRRRDREEILDKLDWIKGVRVQVRVIAPRAGVSAVMTGTEPDVAANGPGSRRTPRRIRPVGAVRRAHDYRALQAEDGGQSAAGSVDAERRPSPAPLPPGPAGAPAMQAAAAKSRARRTRENLRRARPRAHLRARAASTSKWRSATTSASRRPKSRVMAERTEKQIRTGGRAGHSGPDNLEGGSRTIADEVSLSRPAILPSATDRVIDSWNGGSSAQSGPGLSILAIAGSWIHMARRPARLPEPAAKSRRYHVIPGHSPAPRSEFAS